MRARLSTTTLLSCVMMSVAAAADLPPRPVYKPSYVTPAFTWDGWYLGVTGGYGWGSARFTTPAVGTGPSFKTGGADVGATLGFNAQSGSMVYGLETDVSRNWLHGTNGTTPPCPGCQLSNPWFGTFRGRIGYAPSMTMYYLTGGLAYGGVRVRDTFGGDETHTRTGWTAGGGVEHALSRRWSAKLEYLYVDLGKPKFGGGLTTRFHENIARLGLNAHF